MIKATFPNRSGWTVKHNDVTGRPVERFMNAFISKEDEDGPYCGWYKVSVYQQHQGGGRYTDHITAMNFGRSDGPMPCPGGSPMMNN